MIVLAFGFVKHVCSEMELDFQAPFIEMADAEGVSEEGRTFIVVAKDWAYTFVCKDYELEGNKTKEVEKDKDGNKLSEIHYEYDKAGNVTKQTQVNLEEGATKEENLTVESKYYPNGALNYVIDTAGVKTTCGYDVILKVLKTKHCVVLML